MTAPLLGLTGIHKHFGDTVALDAVDLTVRPGTIHALIGENGAGKTTLMRIAFGLIQPDAGAIVLNGQPTTLRSPADAIARGIGMVHQHYLIIPAMTVGENVALGGRGLFDAARTSAEIRTLAERVGLPVDPDALASTLSVPVQQRVEIIKAIARGARLLILDEPTAVLAPAESSELLRWLRALVSNGDTAVVLITHRLADALAVADDITVLRRGRVALTAAARATTEAQLVAGMLGEAVETVAVGPTARAPSDRAAPVLRVEGVGYRDARGIWRVRGATLTVRPGELVGVAGVEGSGHPELLQLLARRLAPAEGALDLPANIAYVPEDRQRDALVLDFTVTENVALRSAGARRGLMRWPRVRARARAIVDALDVRGATPSTPVRHLSGGNQQKLVLGRELESTPSLVVAVNPTRGLDIRAAAAVHARLRSTAAAGGAVVVHCSDLDELLALASRVVVVHQGTVRDAPSDRGAVGAMMLGLR